MFTISQRTSPEWDNGIYRRETTLAPERTVTADMLPAFCGAMTDMGRRQDCKRLDWVYQLHSHMTYIDTERVRHMRTRKEISARNLGGWIEYHERELTWLMGVYAADGRTDMAACTCAPERKYVEPTRDMERAMPGCA